jgi:hypothetical protein
MRTRHPLNRIIIRATVVNMTLVSAVMFVLILRELNHVWRCGDALQQWLVKGQLRPADSPGDLSVQWRWSLGPVGASGVEGAYDFRIYSQQEGDPRQIGEARVGWFEDPKGRQYRLISAKRWPQGTPLDTSSAVDMRLAGG